MTNLDLAMPEQLRLCELFAYKLQVHDPVEWLKLLSKANPTGGYVTIDDFYNDNNITCDALITVYSPLNN